MRTARKKRWSGSDQAFGLLLSLIFLFLFVRFYWYKGELSPLYISLFLFFLLLSLIFPKTLSPLKFIWMKFGELTARIVTPIIMVFLFFVPVSGWALVMRLFRVQFMPLSFQKDGTYWVVREKSSRQDFKKQF